MSGAHTQWWQRLRSSRWGLRGQQQGQSLVIVTFAFIGILAFVGLAIDLGWVYVERVRVAQAADAAALAGASDLPLEGGAHTRALVYLQENGYDYTDVGNVQLFINDPEHPPAEDVHTNIWIDTDYSRDTSLPVPQQVDTADRIRVRVRRDVFMTFMQFIGFRYVSVEATAEAENISNIDTAIVYDRSGSMEFDTLCYGCWEPSEEQQYPSGHLYPLPWSDSTIESADHCAADDRYHEQGGEIYVVIEAEDYSRLSADYHDWGYTPYYSFWVLQRNDYNDSWNDSVGAMGRDSRGAYLSHHPFSNYEYTTGLGVSCTWYDLTHGEYCRSGLPAGGPYSAPRADYDFYAPSEGLYYFHLRGQGGSNAMLLVNLIRSGQEFHQAVFRCRLACQGDEFAVPGDLDGLDPAPPEPVDHPLRQRGAGGQQQRIVGEDVAVHLPARGEIVNSDLRAATALFSAHGIPPRGVTAPRRGIPAGVPDVVVQLLITDLRAMVRAGE